MLGKSLLQVRLHSERLRLGWFGSGVRGLKSCTSYLLYVVSRESEWNTSEFFTFRNKYFQDRFYALGLELALKYSETVAPFSSPNNLYRVPTRTGKTGKPGKMGRHFPVREKSGNFEQTGKVRENHTKYWKTEEISEKNYLLFFNGI